VSEEKVKHKVEALKLSPVEMEAEIKRLELEAKQLEVEERKANLQDVRERLDERQVKRETAKQLSRTNGATLAQTAAQEKAFQARCNHRKGSMGKDGYANGQGIDQQYAVLKHTFMNGDTWVRCLRCAKTWKPPLEENFYFENGEQVYPPADKFGRLLKPTKGTFAEERYQAAVQEYDAALKFDTRNSPSTSYIFRFSDGGKIFRDVMNNATLR
jgi:hypothetical protein